MHLLSKNEQPKSRTTIKSKTIIPDVMIIFPPTSRLNLNYDLNGLKIEDKKRENFIHDLLPFFGDEKELTLNTMILANRIPLSIGHGSIG